MADFLAQNDPGGALRGTRTEGPLCALLGQTGDPLRMSEFERLDLKTMVKLAGMIDATAVALGVAPSRVRTAAAELRKQKLLKTGPRGPGAPDMGPYDATALLLALMYDDELATAADNVEKLYSAPLIQSTASRKGKAENETPPHGFIKVSEAVVGAIGDTIATLIDWKVRYGTIHEEAADTRGLEAFNLTVSVESPFHRAVIQFNDFDAFWTLTYQYKSEAQLAWEAAKPSTGIDLRSRWDAKSSPYMSSLRVVGEDALDLIADALRGHEWRDGDDEISPTYDSCFTAWEMDG